MRLILASQSPRRRQLLDAAGYTFEVIPASEDAESGERPGETVQELVARFGRQKARDVALSIDQGVIIGCDTVAECHGQILGKPRDQHHARQMLNLLRGQEHAVHSGLCLWRRPDDHFIVSTETTILTMLPIPDGELEDYLATDQWVGKAGAFGYQDRTGWLQIRKGSESNVVGLPMELLKQMLGTITRS